MKHLKDYILEGLFDVDKNVIDTHEVERTMFEDPDSEFWKFCVPCLTTGKPVWSIKDTIKKIDIDKEIIYIGSSDVKLDTRFENPFSNKYTLECPRIYIGDPQARAPHPEPVADGGGFKEIIVDAGDGGNSAAVTIDGMCEKLGGFKFKIKNGTRVIVHFAGDLDFFDAEFDFESKDEHKIIALREVMRFPNLKYLKSNAKILNIYESGLFDWTDIKTHLDKFFGEGTITGNGVTKKKNIRNIVAMVNNMRKYGALIPTQVIPEGKLSDLVDVSGLKNLEKVIMRNNNVRISFIKPDNRELITRQAKFIRLNNMPKLKDAPISEIEDWITQCKTKDGWIVLFEPEKF